MKTETPAGARAGSTDWLGALLHCWRLAVEPSGRGRLQDGTGRWRVRYQENAEIPRGGVSRPMCYDVASDYAEMFGGVVERVRPNAEIGPNEAR